MTTIRVDPDLLQAQLNLLQHDFERSAAIAENLQKELDRGAEKVASLSEQIETLRKGQQ